jgi:hypothetical protein
MKAAENLLVKLCRRTGMDRSRVLSTYTTHIPLRDGSRRSVTTVQVLLTNGETAHAAAIKCPDDEPDESVGEAIALARALRALA